ncbi:MAG: response regulator [Patescibacteria group bacterium]
MASEKTKVLLVEDDLMIVEMYKMRFEEEGYAVLVTDKGSEAIEIAEKEKPDIILLDVILPEVDGFTVLQKLKNDIKTKEIPILLLTNLGQESDKEKGLQMGAADYFIKAQHTPVEVIQKIKELINKSS